MNRRTPFVKNDEALTAAAAAGVCFWSGGSRFASEFEGKHRKCFSEGESKSEAGVSLSLSTCAPILKFYSHSSSPTPSTQHSQRIRNTEDRQTAFISPFYCPQFEFNARFEGAVAPPPQLRPGRTREEIKGVEVHSAYIAIGPQTVHKFSERKEYPHKYHFILLHILQKVAMIKQIRGESDYVSICARDADAVAANAPERVPVSG